METEALCKMCMIKGAAIEGFHYDEYYNMGDGKPLFHLDEVLCAEHYNILLKYIEKFGWKKVIDNDKN